MATTKATPSLREAQKRFTHQRLVDAAVEVFERDGYAAARIEDIAAAAGASRATFYLHFKGKAEIVNEIFMDVLLPDSDAIYESLRDLADPSWEQVREFVAGTLTYWDRHRAELQILNQAVAIEQEAIAPTWSAALLETSGVLARYMVELRGLDPEAARVRAILLIAQLDRFYFFRQLPNVELDQDTVLDALADIWWTAFRGRS